MGSNGLFLYPSDDISSWIFSPQTVKEVSRNIIHTFNAYLLSTNEKNFKILELFPTDGLLERDAENFY